MSFSIGLLSSLCIGNLLFTFVAGKISKFFSIGGENDIFLIVPILLIGNTLLFFYVWKHLKRK